MTIRQIANRIIKDIKGWPEEARKSQDVGGPKTSWDEYKEQIQYEEYDSFEVFEEIIESMVRDEVSELSNKVIEKIYRSMYRNYYPADLSEKKSDIVTSILSYIQREAELQDIEYNKPDIEFIRYYVADLTIVAKVLEQVGPEEYLINGYSLATSDGGEQGVANLIYLDQENRLKRISAKEFEKTKSSFKAIFVSEEQAKCIAQSESVHENGNQINILLPNEKQSDYSSTPKDQFHDPKIELENNTAKERARIHKTVKDLVILIAKATKKSPKEIIRGMKLTLEERKAKKDQQAQNTVQPVANPTIKITKNENEIDIARQAAIPNNLNVGLDSNTMQAGITLSSILIESGIIKFDNYVIAMIADIGPGIKPYLKSFYSAMRYQPGFNAEGMDSLAYIDKVDVEKITNRIIGDE